MLRPSASSSASTRVRPLFSQAFLRYGDVRVCLQAFRPDYGVRLYGPGVGHYLSTWYAYRADGVIYAVLASLQCSVKGCESDAYRALLNEFGWLHLECSAHVGAQSSDVTKLLRLPECALAHVRPLGVLVYELTESKTLEIPMDVALALYVMHG